MARPCSICEHSHRAAIDQALAAGELSMGAIGREWSVSPDALSRHRENHLPAELAKAEGARQVARADTLLEQVQELQQKAAGLLEKAEQANDLKAAAAMIREYRSTLELLAKIQGRLIPDHVHLHAHEHRTVTTSKEWRELKSQLGEVLQRHPAALADVQALYERIEGQTVEGSYVVTPA